jgi:hypothetical protein
MFLVALILFAITNLVCSTCNNETGLCTYENLCLQNCNCCLFKACSCQSKCPPGCVCSFDLKTLWNKIDCSNNKLNQTILTQTHLIHSIQPVNELNFNYNQLKLHKFNFFGLTKLEILSLGFNRINRIDENAFNSLYSLRVLNLSNNQIEDLNNFECKQPFGLEDLKIIDLRSNPISQNTRKLIENCSKINLNLKIFINKPYRSLFINLYFCVLIFLVLVLVFLLVIVVVKTRLNHFRKSGLITVRASKSLSTYAGINLYIFYDCSDKIQFISSLLCPILKQIRLLNSANIYLISIYNSNQDSFLYPKNRSDYLDVFIFIQDVDFKGCIQRLIYDQLKRLKIGNYINYSEIKQHLFQIILCKNSNSNSLIKWLFANKKNIHKCEYYSQKDLSYKLESFLKYIYKKNILTDDFEFHHLSYKRLNDCS